jgi:hypothetical protein
LQKHMERDQDKKESPYQSNPCQTLHSLENWAELQIVHTAHCHTENQKTSIKNNKCK